MRTIYKYLIPLDDLTIVHAMPTGAIIRCVAWQRCPCLWIEVQTDAPQVGRKFRVFGTGHTIPDGWVYIGTAFDGGFVWHVYEDMR
jgi:hypothetical protein